MAAAKPGAHVQIVGREPPWIVVDHTLANVNVACWPGCLWRVEIVDPITAADEAATGGGSLLQDAGYTRAAGVKVLESVSVADLFGAHGAEVCTIINVACELTLDVAARLAEARHVEAGDAQTRLWRAWAARECPQLALRSDSSYDGVLGTGARPLRSPIGRGLLVISGEVGRRAEVVEGKSVWSDDPDDPEGALLSLPWSRAKFPLLDAALAVGAPEFLSDSDRLILLDGWRSVFGHDPA
jgi:hypothetical protein